MATAHRFRGLSRGALAGLISGLVMLVVAVAGGSWLVGLAGVVVLIGVASQTVTAEPATADLEPFPLPAELRPLAEALVRPIDPTPKRTLPPGEESLMIAHVATTEKELATLVADKPPAWPWAVFTSVLVLRRNAVLARLRAVASGYQPRPGAFPLNGRGYAAVAYQVMTDLLDLVGQMEQFMHSPAFKGAFGDSESDGDVEAILGVAHRLMDYHESLLVQAETCLQTAVERDAIVFVQDTGLLALCPLISYQRFIPTMCARIGEAQDLLPHTTADTVVALDNVTLVFDLPEGLTGRIFAHIKRFTE